MTTKKKVTKKKVAKKATPIDCTSCLYSRPNFDHDLITCHRYPQTTRALKEHWCGEYKRK